MTKTKTKQSAFKRHISTYIKPSEEHYAFPRKKKMFGQHFLRKSSVVDHMIDKVLIESGKSTVMEIGCGDGFLTSAILNQTACKKLICFEILMKKINFIFLDFH